MSMYLSRLISVLLASTALVSDVLADELTTLSLSRLEQRLEEVDTELDHLANYSLGTGIGAIGYRSQSYTDANQREWIEIDFGKAYRLDEVMLVPAIRRDTDNGFQADGFPMHFRLLAGTGADTNGVLIAEYTCDDAVLPRIAPFKVPCNGTPASWLRVEVEELSARAFDHRYVFQLSEILVFSGKDNIALQKQVRTYSQIGPGNIGWGSQYLVDGFLPYLMDAAQGQQSIAYLAPASAGDKPALILDLEESHPVSKIHLHAVEQSDTLPQAYAGDLGTPKWLRIEGANEPDFSDARILLDLHQETIYDMGPIMMRDFTERSCRYIRFQEIEPSANILYGPLAHRFGFAEIEVYSKGVNIAVGKKVSTNHGKENPYRSLTNLTDGRNMYGNILPIRDWINQLALRHELETERPHVAEELSRRYARQKANLRRMGWLAALLVVATIIIILIDRIIRQRVVYRTRERIAADLHDELGANIHAIGLLGDLAQSAKNSPEKLDRLFQRMRALTERTGSAARHCTNLLEAQGLYEDLVEDMRRTSTRIMADLDHRIEFEGEDVLKKLRSRKRIDLFLFYKECLINVIRHSGATEVHTRLIATPKHLSLTIADNGHGLTGEVPASLKRRARLLGGQVVSEKSEAGGTCISLNLKLKRFGVLK